MRYSTPKPGVSECENCGLPGHEHERERVNHEDGTYSYRFRCPRGDGS